MKTQICKDCEVVFELPVRRGRPAVKCDACRSKAPTVMSFSKNTTGTKEIVELKQEIIEGITWRENAEPCTSCNKTFMRPVKRGRPPTKCPDCAAVDYAAKAEEVTISDEKLEQLFQGDRFSTQGNSWGIA